MTDTSTKTTPILFSAPMVRALLDGRKTQTRRKIKVQPGIMQELGGLAHHVKAGIWRSGLPTTDLCPFGKPGDRLWVRETWAAHMGRDDIKPSELSHDSDSNFWWAADRKGREGSAGIPEARRGKWRPSIFMPRWASRVTLDITEVRVERLQEISEEDAIAEGSQMPIAQLPKAARQAASSERQAYSHIWESINGTGSWDLNPWVWAVGFKVVANA